MRHDPVAEKSGRLTPLSLVVILQARDGIIIAGDSRGTIGDPRGLTAISDVHRKIFRLTSHVGVGVVGSAELGSALLDRMEDKLAADGHQYMDDVLPLFRSQIRNLFNDWFQQFPVDKRPGVLFALGGYRQAEGQLQGMLYMLASQTDFAPHLFDKGTCMIGIPQYATYLSNRYYERKMTVSDATALGIYLIAETASQDPKVGGPIQVAVIAPREGYKELKDGEVKTIQAKNERQNRLLKKFFFGGEES